MKRIVLLAILLAGGAGGYRYYSTAYAPVQTYKEFAEEVLKRHYDVARRWRTA
jgi:hypothetical protein